MNNPEIIILKISISLILLFGVYYFILRKETTFRFIRFFLLFGLVTSIVYPFIPAKIYWSPPEIISQIQKTQPLKNNDIESIKYDQTKKAYKAIGISNSETKMPLILFIYITGVIVLALRFSINLTSLALKIHRKKLIRKDGYIFIDASPGKSIHSFFHFIFLPKEELNKPANSIIEHEKIHAIQFHSLDVLIIEILQILFWFHPLIYLFKNAIVLNHEYLADEHAVKSGRIEYQQSLLEYCIENSKLQLTSGFNFNHIKKRITMMTKQSKKQNIFIKPLAAFIFAGLLFTGLSLKEKPLNAMSAEIEIPVSLKTTNISDATLPVENKDIANFNFQDPKDKEKEIQLKKLMLKRDSIMKTMKIKMQKAQKLAQLKHQEKMTVAKKMLQKKMLGAQKKLEEKQKEAKMKMKKLQQEMEGKEITPEMEAKYQKLEKELQFELQSMEKELQFELETEEASLSVEIEKIESEIQYKLQAMEVEMTHEMEALNIELEKKMTEMELEMKEK